MNEIKIDGYGKLNIGLDVTGRREDGYHLVKMVMQTVDIFDEVTVTKKPGAVLISISTDSPNIPNDERNIAYKAAKAVIDRYDICQGVHIDIKKRIPQAAGMAGGSADAAAVIKAMDALFELDMTDEAKDEIAVRLGADVPYCLRRGTYLSEGIGEKLTKLKDLPKAHIVVVNPGVEVSTKWVYETLDAVNDPKHPDMDAVLEAIEAADLEGICERMENILESVTIPAHPEIQEIKNRLVQLGAEGSLMTGSGPTVFGIFKEKITAEKALKWFKTEKKAYKSYLTGLIC